MTISPVYHNLRPEDTLPQEASAFDLLEQLGIDYDRVSHESADTMEKCAAIGEALGVPVCKNLFLCNRQKTEFYLLLMEPDKPFKTKYLSQQIGSARLSFASAEDLADKLGVTPGSATVLGLMNDPDQRVHLLMDRPIYEAEHIGCHPCICTSTLKLKTADILRVFLPHTGHEPKVVELPWTTE